MSLKIMRAQHRRITKLIQRLCCNYDGGYCIALDDGEPCHCVQELSECGIYCNYFRRAVLLADKKLYAEIIRNNQTDI